MRYTKLVSNININAFIQDQLSKLKKTVGFRGVSRDNLTGRAVVDID